MLFSITIIAIIFDSRRLLLREPLNADVTRLLKPSEGDKRISTSVARRTGTLTGSPGDFDLTLELSNQMLPSQIAAGVIESSYQSLMGISINHRLSGIPTTPIFKLEK